MLWIDQEVQPSPLYIDFTIDICCAPLVCTFEVFLNNTNRTFLSFLYKISIEVSYVDTGPTMLSRHVLTVSDFQILMKSCSIESRNDPSPKKWSGAWNKLQFKDLLFNTCLLSTVVNHWSSVVSSIPTGGNFIFLRHLDANFVQKSQICQICVIYENLVCQCTMKHNKW